ncbi:MAG: HEAT repeat domain-containing protein [Planctomycetota bacterium]|jgi:HEAT repeat protein
MKSNTIFLVIVVVGVVVAALALRSSDNGKPKAPAEGGPPNQPGPYLIWTLDSNKFDVQVEGTIAGGSLSGDTAEQIIDAALAMEGGEYESWELAAVAFYVLAGKGKHDLVPQIRELIDQSDDDWDVGEWSARTGARIPGEEGLRLLIFLSHNEDEDVRKAAAASLSRRKGPEARDALKNLLDDEEDEVGIVAAGGLLGFDDPDAAAEVEKIIEEDDEDWDLALCLGLGVPGNTGALPWLDRLLERDWEEQRVAAVRALGEIGGDQAIERLTALLEDEEPTVGVAAAAALAKNRETERSLPILRKAVKEMKGAGEGEARIEALKALVALGRPEDLDLYREIFDRDQSSVEYRVLRAWAAHGILALEGE